MKNNSISKFNTVLLGIVFLTFILLFLPIKSNAATIGFVDSYCLNVRVEPNTNCQIVGTIAYRNVAILGTATDANGDLWYKINYDGAERYIFAEYVINVHNEESQNSASFEEQLGTFPESYHPYLRAIHDMYPNYVFEANYLNMTYDDAVYQETLGHRKLVNLYNDGVSWRSLSSSAYNRSNGTWYSYDSGWTDAAIQVIEYYMDPRNFLNTERMYIFAKQSYAGNETEESVRKIVNNSFLDGNYTDSTGTHSYIETIMSAAEASGVSPYVIAGTILQEQSRNASPLSSGQDGVYNFFNFGASGNGNAEIIRNGLNYAKSMGWTTVYASIVGGAQLYAKGYISCGQDTYFYKDFNVINGEFYHQYAQSVYDQIGNASFLRSALSEDRGGVVTLRIPVYKTMPVNVYGYPAENSSLSNRYDSNGNVISRKDTVIEMVPAGTNTSPTQTSVDGALMPGDANGDGKISPADYVVVKNHILGKNTISNSNKLKAADMNNDGKISPADYVLIKNTILHS